MVPVRPYLLLSLIWLCFAPFSDAQDIQYPVYKPVLLKSYGIAEGLLDQCVLDAFIDANGKLNIVPCGYASEAYRLPVYQFDGFKSYPYQLLNRNAANHQTMIYDGNYKTGRFYGHYRVEGQAQESPDPCIIFSFDPERGVIREDTLNPAYLENTHLLDMHAYQDGFDLLFYQKGELRLERFTGGSRTLLSVIERDVPAFPGDRAKYKLQSAGGDLWVTTHRDIWRVNRQNFRQKKYSLPTEDLNAITPGIQVMSLPGGDLIANDPYTRNVYMIPPEGNVRLVSSRDFPFFPKRYQQSFAFQDEQGNTLFILMPGTGVCRGFLLDTAGRIFNYHAVVLPFGDAVRNDHRFQMKGENFKHNILVFGNQFSVAELIANSGINAVPMKVSTRSLFEKSRDTILVGGRGTLTTGEGLPRFSRFQGDPGMLPQIHGAMDKENRVIYSMHRKKGLLRYNLLTEEVDILSSPIFNFRFEVMRNGKVIGFDEDQFLVLLDPVANSSQIVSTAPVPGEINDIEIDSSSTLWIAGSLGLFRAEMARFPLTLQKLRQEPFQKPILKVFSDRGGRMLIGTYWDGLINYEPKTGKMQMINRDAGLSNNTVPTILKDADDWYWVATYHGISVLNPELEVMANLYETDGLVNNECNRWSSLRTSDGRLFFGTPSGISLIDPEVTKAEIFSRDETLIYCTSIKHEEDIFLLGSENQSAVFDHGIHLPAENRSIRISYATSQYAAPEKVSYAYKLEGVNEAWNVIGNVHELSLSNLPKGNYDILVRADDYRGQPTSNILRIPVNVKAYFYEQWWFYALCTLPFIVFGVLWNRRQKLEQKRLANEVERRTVMIRKQADDLEKLDRVKTKLYTNITHEFRTPLTVIDGLADKAGTDPQAQDLIRRNAKSLLNLVNQMLDLRKVESGNLKAIFIQSDFIGFMEYLSGSFRSLAEPNGITMHFLADRDRLMMDFDPEKLGRVFSNLISNAVKFTPRGGDIYIQVNTGPEDDQVTVKVRDTGIGIPQEDLPYIFSRFYQAEEPQNDTTNRARRTGTGIGLTLVSEYVHLMGGKIDVSSKQGEGSTFSVALPIHRNADIENTPDWVPHAIIVPETVVDDRLIASFESENGSDERVGRILVVEDNPDVLHYITGCLKDRYTIQVAMDGEEGIEKARDNMPDLVISDVMMPVKDGYALCDALKSDEHTSHIPIILLTAKADTDSRLAGLRRGADAYLSKPFHQEELLLRISKLIELRERLRQRYAVPGRLDQTADPVLQAEDAFIEKFRSTLLAHLDDDQFGIREMCDALHIGRTQLHHKMKSLTGKTTSQYMRIIRLREAEPLLREQNNTISEVAWNVGFRDAKYFARVFKEVYGVSPSEWVERQ